MIKRLKLSDKILFGTIAGFFLLTTLSLIWLRLNWESYVSMVQFLN